MKKQTLEHISISQGNSKTGSIKSVSLPPICTCRRDAPCFKKCYAKNFYNQYKQSHSALDRNLNILTTDSKRYFKEVEACVMVERFFRWHVSGDIVNMDYLKNMVKIAKHNKYCIMMCPTKKYELVNEFLDNGGKLPKNLKIIFSQWGDFPMPNPHNLPIMKIIFKGEQPTENDLICGGNCTECGCRGVGCWQLKNGQTIAIYEH